MNSSQSQGTKPLGHGAAQRRRVLVVDDNHDSANSLAMLVKALGYDTHTAYDGLEAVTAAESFRPNIILLDLGLPTLSGFDACQRIRQVADHSMTIYAVTGAGEVEDQRRTQEAGFDGHLVKPVELSVLRERLAKVAS